MALRLEIISRHRQSLGERGLKEFGQNGGTIGRSLESDWVLPDGQRFLSSRHASIDFRSGSYYIIDTSTNGVYINGSDNAVGRGNPQRLFSGDRIRIGEFEMLVEIDELENTQETLADVGHVDPVDAKQRVEAPDPTSYDLVDAYEITGVGIEVLLDEDEADTLTPGGPVSLELAPDSGPKPSIKPKTEAKAKAKATTTAKRVVSRPAPKVAPTAAAQANGESQPASARGLQSFLRGAGLAERALSERDVEQTLHRLGQLMREVIVGLNENLYLRSAHKNTLKQPNTTIQPRDNNPLKFSAGVDEALENLLFRNSGQYMPAVDAVRDAFGDIKWHQHALFKALEPAVSNFAARLDPERLEEKFSRGRTGALMGAANRLKYWDLFKDLYVVVTQHPAGDLPPQFLEELTQAYEHELGRLRPLRAKQPARQQPGQRPAQKAG